MSDGTSLSRRSFLAAAAVIATACAGDGDATRDRATSGDPSGAEPSALAEHCAPDDGGITLPEGFCAVVVADSLGPARHLDVAPNGDLFVALRGGEGGSGDGVVALRDTDGDGSADVREEWGVARGTGLHLRGEHLYFGADDAVIRYPLPEGSLTPGGTPDTIVTGLPDTESHTAKPLAFDDEGNLYVNVGSPSNTCQVEDRVAGSPGQDPCPELDTRAGIWRFDADRSGQTQADGTRFATGLRNTVALRVHPQTDQLWGAVHGRDQLMQNWPDLFDARYSAENPAEEFVAIDEGDDFGWPYCYYSNDLDRKVLAPEYGGDGEEVGRCAEMEDPVIAFPGHWAPNDLEFYTAAQFPESYHGGVFVAFHGSWNRAPEPQGGYNVVFAPFRDGQPTGQWDVFAEGFPAGNVSPGSARFRPSGLALGPDGSLYVAEDQRGRIWRIVFAGP